MVRELAMATVRRRLPTDGFGTVAADQPGPISVFTVLSNGTGSPDPGQRQRAGLVLRC